MQISAIFIQIGCNILHIDRTGNIVTRPERSFNFRLSWGNNYLKYSFKRAQKSIFYFSIMILFRYLFWFHGAMHICLTAEMCDMGNEVLPMRRTVTVMGDRLRLLLGTAPLCGDYKTDPIELCDALLPRISQKH